MTDSVLSRSEVERLTGYKRPGDQLRELRDRGFYRARRAKVSGEVILERPHYDAVAAGTVPANHDQHVPQVKPPRMRRVK